MTFILVIGGIIVVLLVVAFLIDRRAKQVRGAVPRMKDGGMFKLSGDTRTNAQLSEAIGGRHLMEKVDGPPEPADLAP